MHHAADRFVEALRASFRTFVTRLHLLVALLIPCLPPTEAQGAIGPVEVIPITQFKTPYFYYSEDGSGITCGAYLQGSFPVYKNHTNLASYTLNITGLSGWSGIRSWDERNPGVGGRFVFTATFTGGTGPASGNPDCGRYMNAWADLPPWTATVVRLPPRASFTANPVPGSPGTFNFQSTSTDPEEEPLTEAWDFGDGTTAGGTTRIHRYTKPLSYNTRLVVTDLDGLNSTSDRTIIVRAPTLVTHISLQSKHKGNRIELEEEFGLRVTVVAADDGVGALNNLAFVTGAVTLSPTSSRCSKPRVPSRSEPFNPASAEISTGGCARTRSASSASRRPPSPAPMPQTGTSRPRAPGCVARSPPSSSACTKTRPRWQWAATTTPTEKPTISIDS